MGAAVGARAALDLMVPDAAPFLTLFPAVTLVGLCCGPAAGGAAAVLGVAAAEFLWLSPSLPFALSASSAVNLVGFLLACGLMLWTSAALRRALLEADSARSMVDTALGCGEVGAWELDLVAWTVRASASAHVLHGIPADGSARSADDWLGRLEPGDAERLRQTVSKTAKAQGSFSMEYCVPQPDGSVRWIVIRGGTAGTAPGVGTPRLIGTMFDVTDRVRTEEAMRARETRLRMALEAGALGTWEIDLRTRRGCWDARLAAMLGLPPEPVELDAEHLLDFVHPADRDRVRRDFETAVASGFPYGSETRSMTAAGELRWFVNRGIVVAGSRGQERVIGVTSDVTERRHREDTLRKALEARKVLMREADHRIKNSLQLVMSLLRLQQARLSDHAAADALSSAIGRVEAVAQSHSALRQSEDVKTIDLSAALRELCARLSRLSPGIAIHASFEDHLLLDVERAIPLALIVSELLTNAVRHAYPGGHGAVTVSIVPTGSMLVVAVSDEGVGMEAAGDIKGLGTTVVQSLAKHIEASVSVRSSPGGGTTVRVKLPSTNEKAPYQSNNIFPDSAKKVDPEYGFEK